VPPNHPAYTTTLTLEEQRQLKELARLYPYWDSREIFGVWYSTLRAAYEGQPILISTARLLRRRMGAQPAQEAP
jgi:hypothetical protein